MASSTAHDITIEDDILDIYIAGQNNNHACYWINNKDCIFLDDAGSYSSEARSIYFSNNNLYIGGIYQPISFPGDNYPCYWVNGKRYNLERPGNYHIIRSIYYHDDNIYCIGYDTGAAYSYFWKNQKIYWTSNPNQLYFNDLFIFDQDFYISGQVMSSNAFYLKNFFQTNLTSPVSSFSGNSIFIKKRH